MQLDLLDAPAISTPKLSAEPTELVGESEPKEKSPAAFKTITEVATLLDVQQYVLRFWESKFSQIKPVKMRGGRRYYRPEDIAVLQNIKHLLYKQGYTIKGAKKALSSKPAQPKAPPKISQAVKEQGELSEKQISQLAVIRQELVSLRNELKPHVF